jgi:hypothetical protein
MISANVAPFGRFIMAITSAFLLARSAFGLVAWFVARAFFADLALLGWRSGFAAAAVSALLPFSGTIGIVLMVFLLAACCFSLPRVAVVTIHHSVSEKWQADL